MFLVELRQKSVLLLLGVGDDRIALGVGLGNDLRALLFAVAHVLVVNALSEGEHRGSGLRVLGPRERQGGSFGCRGGRRGGRLGGSEVRVGELGDAPLCGLELLLQILVLHLEGVDGGDNLIEELINLVLVIALAELDVLELLVEDILGSEQGHFFASRSFRLDMRLWPHVWTTGKAALCHVTKIITEIVTLATSITT